MGIFLKPEIIIFKESNSAEEHLAKLEELLPRATGKVKENIQKEIILTKAGIDGEKKVLYELKNSNMDLVVLQDICIRAKDGREAQIDFVIVTSKLMKCKWRYLQQQGRLYVRYVAENLCFERHAAEQIQENNFMAVPVSRGADTY